MPTGRYSPKGQPLFRAQIYKDPKYRAWCEFALPYFLGATPESPMVGPLKLELVVVLPFLKSDQRKSHVPRKWAHVKPDLDNVGKAVLDCAEEAGWFKNDSQVCRSVCEKVRAEQGEGPSISVRVSRLEVPYHVR
jgi:Holliday junction resolvase RusA-like endonuclease